MDNVTIDVSADEKAMKKEGLRLKRLFKNAEENKLKLSQKEIETAAFLTVVIRNLEKDIKENGYKEEYQNGANQKGVKESTAAKLHVTYTKNLLAIMRQLNERLGGGANEKSDAFDDF